jgi:hypothetical protein
MKVVDYEILVQNLTPSIGEILKFFAVIEFLVIETPNGRKIINPNLSETHGRTAEEARAKMQAKLDKWMQENS